MKKKTIVQSGGNKYFPRKWWLMMKLGTVFCFLLTLNVTASAYSQQNEVSLNLTGVTLEDFIEAVKCQTGVNFVYNASLFRQAGKISVEANGESLDQVLERVLGERGFVFDYEDEVVVIRKGSGRPVQKSADKKVVTGVVKDAQGTTLPGVSVTVKGSQAGVATDLDGRFEIRVDDRADVVLIFSFVGMKTKEVGVGNQERLLVTLEPDTKALEEVVVTGYQTISKERATGSFDIISMDQIAKPASDLATRLIGTTAGMQNRLDSDGNLVFEIRGQTSLNTNARPLIVVDGFAVENEFSSINPNDVESVTILKDAAAASIWGARSANGVIVVTTKKGKQNKGKHASIDVSAFVKISPKLDMNTFYPFASSAEVVDYEIRGFSTNFFGGPWSPLDDSYQNANSGYSQAVVALNEHRLGYLSDEEMNETLEKLKKQDNRRQIKKYLLQVPVTQQYNVNISGAGDRMSNVLSFMYENEKNNFKENDTDRFLVNYRTTVKLTRWLDFNFSGMFQYNNIDHSGSGNITSLSPYDMLVNEDGSRTALSPRFYAPILQRYVPTENFPYADWTYNPITEIENQSLISKQLNTRIQTGLTLKIWKGLSLDSKIQYEMYNTNNTDIYNEKTFTVRSTVNLASSYDNATGKVTPNLPKGGFKDMSKTEINAYSFRNQLNFNYTFADKHDVNLLVGSEINERIEQTTIYPRTYGYDDDRLTVGLFPNGPTGTKNWLGWKQTFSYTNEYSYVTDRYFSLFGNAAYTYDGKYTLSGSLRTDASNLITDDPKYRYTPFWSVGLGWQLGKENFMQAYAWLDRLNIRATYGYNGNVDKSTSFRPLINVAATQNDYTHEVTSRVSSFGNPSLRWEKTGTWDIGVDYSCWSGKFYGKIDVYSKNSKDLITSMTIPAVKGTTTQKLNAARMTNQGVELEIGARMPVLGSEIVWTGDLNFSYNKNKITKLYKATYRANELYQGGTSAYVEGYNANTLWAFKYAGIINNGTESNPDWQPVVQGANGEVYDFTGWTPGDGRDYMLDMGTVVAPYTLGFSNSFKIYDFDLSFIITGKFGHKFKRCSFNYPSMSGGSAMPNKMYREVLDSDPMKMIPVPLDKQEPHYYFWDRFYPYMDYLVESASHVRIQEINISYTLPVRWLSKAKINSFQIYVQGNNLHTFVKNKYGEDPEYPMNPNGGTIRPRASYTLGLKFNF